MLGTEFTGDAGLSDLYGSALSFGADNSFITPRGTDTVPTDAVQSMQPVSDGASSGWNNLFQDVFKGVVGYSLAKDAVQSGVTRPAYGAAPAYQGQQQQAQRPQSMGGLLPLLLVGGLIVFAVKS